MLRQYRLNRKVMITDTTRRVHALGLLSGGLDSQLALCVVREQGIDVEAVFYESPFCDSAGARRAASGLGVYLHVIDFTPDIVAILENPRHGFGSCLNPCIDCHARMFMRTGQLMEDLGYQFFFTGEVLNQRPMSQRRRSLETVATESGYADVMLRPLSAGLLPATMPERNGWVDRARLLSIEGRSRKQQMELAGHYGIREYPTPAGGCRLTEPNFCRRLDDLRHHEGLHGARSLHLLRVGRHFRIGPRTKLVVGRNEHDNASLEGNAELYDVVLKVEDVPGPTALLPLTASDAELQAAAEICARYSDCADADKVWIRARYASGSRRLQVAPASRESVAAIMV